MIPYKKIFPALNRVKIKYLVAGGVAVNLHGMNRFTVDLDLIVHLEKTNDLKFLKAMTALGYVAKVPVRLEEFADEGKRESWILEKGMIVFSFVNPNNPMELIDVFVREPLPFGRIYGRKKVVTAFGTRIPILGIKDLITLKQRAGRPKDLYDISLLRDKNAEQRNKIKK